MSAQVRALRGRAGKCETRNAQGGAAQQSQEGGKLRMEIAFGILGQTTMRMHDRLSTGWGPLKLQKVLAALLARPGDRWGVSTLAAWVWSVDERAPNDPVTTFRTYAARIGKALREADVPAALRTVDGALQIEVERTTIDYFAFEAMIETARRH